MDTPTPTTFRAELAKAWADARKAIELAAPALVRFTCGALGVGGVAWAAPVVWLAYGGDVAALLPASTVLLPMLLVRVAGLGWGALALSGVGAILIGVIVSALDPIGRALLLVAILATSIHHQIHSGRTKRNGK